jgi:phospholipid transport system substrate-binding protein
MPRLAARKAMATDIVNSIRAGMRRRLAAALLATTLAVGPSAFAAPSDPAAARVDAFDNALLETMKGGAALGVKGRARKLAPAVEGAFDLATMTRFAVGPTWAQMTPAQQSALTAAFGRLSAASYAHNFDKFGGERFELDPNVQTRGADKIVQSKLIPPHDKPVQLLYRMRQTPDGWKIIDVYYDGVSQLTTRRSDFAQSVDAGGAEGLLGHLNALTEKMLK